MMLIMSQKSEDQKAVYSAIVKKQIAPLRKSKIDYKNFAERKIHLVLLSLYDEFKYYDLNNEIIHSWAVIRAKNALTLINQIRQRAFYYKPINWMYNGK